MANKRMFSNEITGSDAFLEMPVSSQALYFHLGMVADDDGFVGSPKRTMRIVGASEDDLKILITKAFLIAFPSGVLVVKHHRMNNNWDKYNCKRTVYLEEFSQLYIKENKAYTLDKTQGIPMQSENRLKPVFRIEENRIEIPANAGYRIEEGTHSEEHSGDSKSPRVTGLKKKAYDELLAWSENERGFPFPGPTITKQYRAFNIANASKIPREKLIERWEEMSADKFWQKAGFDWMNVVDNIMRKPL